MSDNIKKRDVQTGLEVAWHGKTNVVETITKENAGINYEMEKRPLYRMGMDGAFEASKENFELVSSDDNLPIGRAVSESYCQIANPQMWDMVIDALTGTSHKIVSAGTVDDRTKAWISIQIDEAFMAADRMTESVLNIIWGHAGKVSILGKTGVTVIVCNNTLQLALNEKGEFLFKVKHTKNANLKLVNMGEAIERHIGVAKEFKVAMDSLANNSCGQSRAERIYAGFVTPLGEDFSSRTRNTVTRLTSLFRGDGAGNHGENESDLLNGLTDYYSHENSGGRDNRWKQFVSSEFGSGMNRKAEFYNLLTKGRQQLADIEKRGDKLLSIN